MVLTRPPLSVQWVYTGTTGTAGTSVLLLQYVLLLVLLLSAKCTQEATGTGMLKGGDSGLAHVVYHTCLKRRVVVVKYR